MTNLWPFVAYAFQAILLIIAGVLIYLIILGVYRGLRQSFRDAKLKKMDLDRYLSEARMMARLNFIDEQNPITDYEREAFLLGARWAWGAHRRKR